MTLDPEVGSEALAVMEVLGGGRAREIGRDFAFSLGLDEGFGSSTAMRLSSFPSPAPLLTFSLCLVSRRDILNPLHRPRSRHRTLPLMICGRIRVERDAKAEACDRTVKDGFTRRGRPDAAEWQGTRIVT
jgi:hypothetical protein